MADIVMIPIDKLNPHPDNPRKDLGDLSELVESIKSKGVLQNLTVVPYYSKVQKRVMDGLYTILIGHRRASAAKLAGLTELPCSIVDMSYEDQIATMLVENMQRSDLTVWEEGKGVQMMINLGKSVKDISEMTGFSETKIRQREKIARYDERKVKKGLERGATLYDFAELDKIEDDETREKLLGVIGTSDWKNELAVAKKKQKEKVLKDAWHDQVSKWATRIDDVIYGTSFSKAVLDGREILVSFYRTLNTYSQKGETVETPDDLASAHYYYIRRNDGDISIYRGVTKEEEDAKTAEENARRELQAKSDKKKEQFKEITERHRQLRFDFMKNFNQFQKRDANVWEFVTEAMIYAQRNGGGFSNNSSIKELSEILNVKLSNPRGDSYVALDYHEFLSRKKEKPEQTALLTAMWIMDRGQYWTTQWSGNAWLCIPAPCERLDQLYRLLDTLGYQRSTEENEMRNGTHKLFDKEDDSDG